MTKLNPFVIAGIALVGLAVAIALHHLAKHGYLFDQNDVMNHEIYVAMFSAAGAVALVAGGVIKSK